MGSLLDRASGVDTTQSLMKRIEDMDRIVKELENLTKITLRSTEKTDTGKWDTFMRTVESRIKSATDPKSYVSSAEKSVASNGSISQSFYVSSKELENVNKAIADYIKKAALSQSSASGYVLTKNNFGNLVNKDSIKELTRNMEAVGGRLELSPTDSIKNNYSALIPYSAAGYANREGYGKYIDSLSDHALTANGTAFREKLSAINDRALAKSETQSESESKKKSDDEKNKGEKNVLSSIASVMQLNLIGKVLYQIYEITKKILKATLENAEKTFQDTLSASTVNLSYMEKRGYDLFDLAKGLKPGTSFGAIQEIQNKFGNIVELDEKSLSGLARVITSDTEKLIRSGIGGDKPDVIMKTILDDVFNKYLQGQNSIGTDVGRKEAKRELYSYLMNYLPALAPLFIRRVADSERGINTADWYNTINTNRYGITESEKAVSANTGSHYYQLKANLSDGLDKVLTHISVSVDRILQRMLDIRVGMSDEAKAQANEDAKENNAQVRKKALDFVNNVTGKSFDSAEYNEILSILDAKDGVPNAAYNYKLSPQLLASVTDKDSLDNYLKMMGLTYASVGINPTFDGDIKKPIQDFLEFIPRAAAIYRQANPYTYGTAKFAAGKFRFLDKQISNEKVKGKNILNASFDYNELKLAGEQEVTAAKEYARFEHEYPYALNGKPRDSSENTENVQSAIEASIKQNILLSGTKIHEKYLNILENPEQLNKALQRKLNTYKNAEFAGGMTPEEWNSVDRMLEVYGKYFTKDKDGNYDKKNGMYRIDTKKLPPELLYDERLINTVIEYYQKDFIKAGASTSVTSGDNSRAAPNIQFGTTYDWYSDMEDLRKKQLEDYLKRMEEGNDKKDKKGNEVSVLIDIRDDQTKKHIAQVFLDNERRNQKVILNEDLSGITVASAAMSIGS